MNGWKDDNRIEFGQEEEGNEIVTLTLEDGSEEDFEVLDVVEYQGGEYVILLPAGDEECDEVIIVRSVDKDEQIFESVDDDETLVAVFELFQQNLLDLLSFDEEE